MSKVLMPSFISAKPVFETAPPVEMAAWYNVDQPARRQQRAEAQSRPYYGNGE